MGDASQHIWLSSCFAVHESMQVLLQEGSCVDVTLVCSGEPLPAHRLVLASVSPFLKSLLEEHTDEATVVLPDVQRTTMEKLVQFVYTGCLKATLDEIKDIFNVCAVLKLDLAGGNPFGDPFWNKHSEDPKEPVVPVSNVEQEEEEDVKPDVNQLMELDQQVAEETAVVHKTLSESQTEANQCQFCGKTFPEKWYLKYHLSMHLGAKPFKCRYCQKRFTQLANLRTHEKAHRQMQLMKTLAHSNKVRENMRSAAVPSTSTNGDDSSSKLYKCNLCNKSFNEKWYLQYHMNIHTGSKPFKCQYCNKQFAQPSNMKTHEKIHQRTWQYSWNSANSDSIQATVSTADSLSLPVVPEQCEGSENSVPRRQSFDDVTDKLSGTSPAAHACAICDKTFPSRWYLKYHMNAHSNRICNKTLPSDAKPNTPVEEPVQQQLENGDASVKIEPSDVQSEVSASEEPLVDVPHDPSNFLKPYRCHLCGKSFSEKWYLQYHINTHTGNKPFKCPHCSKSFAQPSNMRTHVKTAHASSQNAHSVPWMPDIDARTVSSSGVASGFSGIAKGDVKSRSAINTYLQSSSFPALSLPNHSQGFWNTSSANFWLG